MNRDIGQWLEDAGQQLNGLSSAYSNILKKAMIVGCIRLALLIIAILCVIGFIFLIYHVYTQNRKMEQYNLEIKSKKRELKKLKRMSNKEDIDPDDICDLEEELNEIIENYDYSKNLKTILIKRCYIVVAICIVCIVARIFIYNFFVSKIVNQVTNFVDDATNIGVDENTENELDVGSSTSTQEIDEQYERVKTQVEEEAQKRAEEEAQYKELTQEAYKAFAGTYRGFVYDGEAYVDVQLRSDGSCTSPFYTYSDGDSANHEGTWTVVLGDNQKIDVNDAKIHIQLNWIYNGQSYSASGTLFNGYRLNINGIDYNKFLKIQNNESIDNFNENNFNEDAYDWLTNPDKYYEENR